MSILVTGGAGYIGSHTVKLLKTGKKEVVVYDNLVKGHKEAVKDSILVEGDILDTQLLKSTIQRYDIDMVVHFAAHSQVGESMVNPRLYYHNNVKGTLNLLDAMMDTDVKKLVFSSTAAVYGEAETAPIKEDAPQNPTNVYGRTKLIMENAMADYSAAYGLKYIALRYFNASGAAEGGDIGEDHRPETHLVPLILNACLGKTEGIKIFGDDYPTKDGTCVRDYIHVSDLAMAHSLAVEALYNGCASNIYNLGNGNGFSVKQVISATELVTGINVKEQVTARRSGDPSVLIASSEKIQKELCWSPKYTNIEDIITTAWAWHSKFPNGYEK